MGKKILILNGSPRPKGNTAGLIKAFAEGAEKSGHTVKTFLIDKMNIKGCKSCYKGGKNPDSPCTQKDDMDKIYPEFNRADIIVFASPMYYWGLSGQIKIVLDRLFATFEMANKAPKKKAILLMAAGDKGEYNNKPAIDYFDALLERLGWVNKGIVIAEGVLNLKDIDNNPALEEALKLGESL